MSKQQPSQAPHYPYQMRGPSPRIQVGQGARMGNDIVVNHHHHQLQQQSETISQAYVQQQNAMYVQQFMPLELGKFPTPNFEHMSGQYSHFSGGYYTLPLSANVSDTGSTSAHQQNAHHMTSSSAGEKMAGQQNDSSASFEEKLFVYHQGHIDVEPLYLATKLADVHFAFDSDDGTVTRIPAHKVLLGVTSDVFEKMFCGDLKETGDVEIVDASAEAFQEFLQFFYLSEIKLSVEHLGSVLYLGNKYNVENCIDACVKFFTGNLSNENVCIALSHAILHDQEELTKQCEKQIILNTADVFKSAGFLQSSKEALTHMLKMNLLSCTEVEVFEACMQWVRAKSEQQELSKALVEEHLGDLYYEIRFASMTIDEFLTLDTKYSAVLSNDFKAIIRLIGGADIDSQRLNILPRQAEWNGGEGAIISCDRNDSDPHKCLGLSIEEKTIFSTNKTMVLGQFTCNQVFFDKSKPQSLKTELSIDVKITEARTLDNATDAKVLCSTKANMGSGWTTVSLPHPILIQSEFFYSIRIKGFPKGHCFQSADQKSCVNLKSDIKIEFHKDKKTTDGKIFGLIYELKFNEI